MDDKIKRRSINGLAVKIAQTIKFLHEKGIILRNLDAEIINIRPDAGPVISNLGQAQLLALFSHYEADPLDPDNKDAERSLIGD